MSKFRVVAILALFLAVSGAVLAQTSSGTITGRVVDTSGGGVPGAEVRLINHATKDSRMLLSNQTGGFVFTDIQPGTFTISVKAQGFKQYDRRELHLAASDSIATGDLQLQVGSVSETVEVQAEIAQVQTASGDRTALLDSKQIGDLLARGRDVIALLQIYPGVINDATGGDTLGQFSTPTINGVRQYYNTLNIDGISGNTARGRTAESPINMDAIDEVKVLTNSYTAEYGTAAGSVINLVTKSGTQTFHGGAYYYNRNEAFNANTFFNNRSGIARQRYRFNTTGYNFGGPVFIPKHFNTSKQKLFFFFSQEILPNESPNSLRNFTVPTALERQGNFSQSVNNKGQLLTIKDPLNNNVPFSGGVITPGRIDANSAKLLSIFPLPNATNTAVTNFQYNFQIAGSEKIPVQQEILRMDYFATEKARLYVRASGYSSDNTGLTSPAISNQWGPANVDYAQTMPNIGSTFTYVFSPTLVNEVTFGMNLWTESQKVAQTELAKLQRATYGINIAQSYPADNPLGLLPSMSFGGVTNAANVSYDGRFPMVDDSTLFSLSDGLSKVWGPHLIKVGFTYQHGLYNQYHQAGSNNFPGNFSFATDANNPIDTGYAYSNAVLGYYDTYTESTNRVNYAPITKIFEWYAQDHWKVASRLTIDIGLRFTYSVPMSPDNNNAGNFVPYLFNPSKAPVLYTPAKVAGKNVVINPLNGTVVPNVYSGLIVPGTGDILNGIITPSTPGFPRAMVYDDGLLTAPRFGFAWQPFSNDGKTVIRGGAGIFYSPRLDIGTLGNLFFNPPAIFNPTQYYGNVATAANGTGLLSPSSFSRDIDPHAKTVTAYQANFGIQRNIGWGTVLDVSYVGSFGRHLGETIQLNQVPYGAEFLPQNQNPQTGNTPLNDNFFRPFPGYGNIPQQIFEGNSSYHSLQVQVTRRYAKGLQFGLAYTRSKALDYAEGDSTTSPSGTSNQVARFLNRRVWDYGLASYDRPNVATFYFLWDVPRLSRLLPNAFVKAVLDGWQVSDITTYESGQPLSVTLSTNPSVNFTGGGDGARPLIVGNPNTGHTFYQWFNVAAFAEPTPIDPKTCTTAGCPAITVQNIGNSPKMPIRGPGVANWNTSLFKNFSIKERFFFQLRGEAYNTFNHTQYNAVNTTVQYNAAGQQINAAAGNITSARDPRIMQLALRVRF
jgi:hypothetical protein